MITPRRHRRRAGLSLLEVLIATAIFMVSIAAVSTLVERGTRNAVDSARQNTGLRLAQSKMAEVEAGVVDMTSTTSGTFDEDPDWSWSISPAATNATNVYLVTLTVTNDRGRKTELTYTQMVYDPAQTAAAGAAENPNAATTGTGP